jgi:hypothetical protein
MRRAVYRRACKVSLDFVTTKKRHEIARLLEAYPRCCQFLHPLAVGGTRPARRRNPRPSSQRAYPAASFLKDQAPKQALAIVNRTKKAAAVTGAKAKRPVFKGAAILCHGVDVEDGRGSFNLIVRLSTLRKGERITLPTTRTAMLSKWLTLPRARLVQSCALCGDHRSAANRAGPRADAAARSFSFSGQAVRDQLGAAALQEHEDRLKN